jgi:hypothetical protein
VLRIGAAVPTVHVPFTEQVVDQLDATGRLAPETTFQTAEDGEALISASDAVITPVDPLPGGRR